ncbi:MAG: hypothetical protein IKP53_02410 [Candidatus Methanomethylophilaceae archaeon]|nr:hypothetical protein [Candidatus Methanomethylophilaceae archaeon]MBR7006939.1 hypothetical protein [Candidatus Methanomethylophilaceae archaeon]
MISKNVQYMLYAGTRKEDYSGWRKVDVQGDEGMDYWSLDLGGGYSLERISRKVKRLLWTKWVRINALRHDGTIEDPDGDYMDSMMSVLFNVRITVDDDTIKFESKNESFAVISREPVDWKDFESGKPDFEETDTSNWSSFYS